MAIYVKSKDEHVYHYIEHTPRALKINKIM